MKTRNRLLFTAALLAAAAIGNTAQAKADCKLKFTISGWSAFYKRSDGSGTITCTNGQSMRVRLRARGGGPTVGPPPRARRRTRMDCPLVQVIVPLPSERL